MASAPTFSHVILSSCDHQRGVLAGYAVNDTGVVQFPAHLCSRFLDPEGGSQNTTLVVVVLGISSLKIPKAFLIRSGAQRYFAYTFLLIFPTDLLARIFNLIYNE